MKLTAIEPIKANGKRHEPGQTFEVEKQLADKLVDSGAAKAEAEHKPAPKK